MKEKKRLRLELEAREREKAEKKENSALNMLKKRLAFLKWLDPFTYADLGLEKIGKKESQTVSWLVYLGTAFVSALLLYTLLGLLFHSPSPMVIVVSGSMEPTFYRGDVMALSGWNLEELNAPLIEMPDTEIDGLDISEFAYTECSLKGVEGVSGLVSCRAVLRELQAGRLQVPVKNILAEKIVFFDLNREIDITEKGDVVVYFSEAQGIPIIHRAVAKIRAKDGFFVLTKGDSVLNSFIDQDTALSYGAVPFDKLQGKTFFMVPWIGYVKLILMDDLPCFLTSPMTKAKCQFP
jgi:signal peptidase I